MIKTAWDSKEKKVLVLCLLQIFFAVASNLVNLYVSPSILSTVEQQRPFTQLLSTILFFVALTMLCSAVTSYISSNTLYGRMTTRMVVVSRISQKCCLTSYPNTEDDKFIALRSKCAQATGSNSEASEAIWDTLVSLGQNVLGFTIYILLLSSINFWLILIIIATALIGYFVNKYLNSYGYRHREEEGEITTKIGYQCVQARNYTAAKNIRIFGMKPWMDEITAKAMGAFKAFHRRANNVYVWGRILDLVLAFLRNGIAYGYLIYLVLNNGVSVAQFLLYFSAIGGFTSWVSGILSTMITLYRQSLDISTIREFIDYPEPFAFEEGKPLPFSKGTLHEIRLENVSFKYPGAESCTLENINLTLHPGEKLAVVGMNGAGKTTLVKIICGFLDPTEGRVLLDGQDIRVYNRRDYYRIFSAVFQTFSLLAGTIATNVAQSEDNQDMQVIKDCIEKAGLTKKIMSLPESYQTHLNRTVYDDAVELSGGEAQRLMLARALYKKAPFIILDEPTAALDPIAEADVYNKYNQMTAGCSSVYISHRLASTRFCDRIVLIHDCKIAEEGTHEELLKLGGKYTELFEVQSRYYREGDIYGNEKEVAELA